MKSYRDQPQSGELFPQNHKEMKQSNVAVSNLSYCDDNNPQELQKNSDKLADYAKKHKNRY